MKKLLLFILVAPFIYITIIGFDTSQPGPSQIIGARQAERLDKFMKCLAGLKEAVGRADTAEIRYRYKVLRAAFKQWEYIGEYCDPSMVKDHLNGAPLPKIERNSFGLNVQQPKGMQAMDELVSEDSLLQNLPVVAEMIDDMLDALASARRTNTVVYDRTVLEAAKMELVRLFTLGLTGFDVPASGNSIEDAIIVVETIQSDLRLYQPLFEQTNPKAAKNLYTALEGFRTYLESHRDFDNLDRLAILKRFVNPLFHELRTLHLASGIETIYETTSYLPPYNYSARNIFDPDFLDPFRYIGLPREMYTPGLVSLGRTLFFDPVLSGNIKRSCASCHSPEKAFTDGNAKSLAMGMDGTTVSRNAPTLINCVFSERYFHDMRADALEDQIEHVIVSKQEFNTRIFDVTSRLSESEEYQKLFRALFPDIPGQAISNQNIAFAISAYVTSLSAFNAPFDQYVRGGSNATLSPAARRGFNLFMGKAACGTCHYAPLFNGTVPPRYEESESEVLGVPENPYAGNLVIDPDKGRALGRLKENAPFYEYSFKTPTLRNIALTAPYMHNGAYRTLDDVMNFYNNGGGTGIGIHNAIQTLPGDSLHLTKKEIADIIAFMTSLTDTSGLTSKPVRLPGFSGHPEWNRRRIGGEY